MDDHFVICLRVVDSRYSLKIKRADEEIFRKAAIEIEGKLNQYKNRFTGDSSNPLDKADYMAMVAIQAVSEKVEHQLKAEMYEARLKVMNLELDKYLESIVK